MKKNHFQYNKTSEEWKKLEPKLKKKLNEKIKKLK